ncbi:hypothetical protein FA09DRAFT_324921 [Tilletiopsis washingtonensis]|uniref:Uncharacterized protein n=1 Tax=Tilletiopsis washingtonensis TaxID=58919 RepID=A0A316ZEI1_9BASI|nr:hypothetical protein FA09DRAFT_324921 [Tilletiopsis washingtonensis]PWN99444.1 hypothetical protein FA09DRAFT_324921 [Tilletiopsis washingtonensis]
MTPLLRLLRFGLTFALLPRVAARQEHSTPLSVVASHNAHPLPVAPQLHPPQSDAHEPSPDVWSDIAATRLASEVQGGRWRDFVPESVLQVVQGAEQEAHGRESGSGELRRNDGAASPPQRQQQQQQQQRSQPQPQSQSQQQHYYAPQAPPYSTSPRHAQSDACAPQARSDAHLYSSSSTLGESTFDKLLRHAYWLALSSYRSTRYLLRVLLLSPLRTLYHIARYSLGHTWHTTTWAGERAVWRPLRTFAAPLVFLIQGFTFLFVATPYWAVQVVVRELYPVYIFLGAALALGTSIGLGAAATLYIGSFFFSDSAPLEQDLSSRVDEVRRDVPLLQSPQRSASGKKGRKKGGGLLERSIRELERARERQKMQSSAGARGGAWEEESDEDDGYFAHSRGASGSAASESGGGGGGGQPQRRLFGAHRRRGIDSVLRTSSADGRHEPRRLGTLVFAKRQWWRQHEQQSGPQSGGD